MSLIIGSEDADSGMSLAIFQEIDRLLSPPLQQAVDEADDAAKPAAQEALDGARDGWRKLSFAIAFGVIGHLITNMEINGIQTRGSVSTSVEGDTGSAEPANHTHEVDLTGSATNVTFTQNNNGTGLVA